MTWQQLLVLRTYHRERIRAWCAKSSMISCKLPSPTEETEISNFESKTTLSGHSCSPAGRLSSQSSKFLGGSGVFGLLFFCSCFSSSWYWARIACTRGSIEVVESECYLDELLWFFPDWDRSWATRPYAQQEKVAKERSQYKKRTYKKPNSRCMRETKMDAKSKKYFTGLKDEFTEVPSRAATCHLPDFHET